MSGYKYTYTPLELRNETRRIIVAVTLGLIEKAWDDDKWASVVADMSQLWLTQFNKVNWTLIQQYKRGCTCYNAVLLLIPMLKFMKLRNKDEEIILDDQFIQQILLIICKESILA